MTIMQIQYPVEWMEDPVFHLFSFIAKGHNIPIYCLSRFSPFIVVFRVYASLSRSFSDVLWPKGVFFKLRLYQRPHSRGLFRKSDYVFSFTFCTYYSTESIIILILIMTINNKCALPSRLILCLWTSGRTSDMCGDMFSEKKKIHTIRKQ